MKIMKCRKCKMEIPKGARKCPYCGTNQGISCSGLLGAAVFFIVVIVVISVVASRGVIKSNTDSVVSTASTNSISFQESISKETGLDDSKSLHIKSLLDEAELSEYKSISKFSSDEEYDYYYIEASAETFVLVLDKLGNVDELNIKLSSLPPLIKSETVEHKYSEYTISRDMKNALRVECQLQLENSVLKSPSSAKYPAISGWSFTKDFDTGYIYVSSYVDADNSFGAKVRGQFKFGFRINDYDNIDYDIVYCIFDDTVIVDRR